MIIINLILYDIKMLADFVIVWSSSINRVRDSFNKNNSFISFFTFGRGRIYDVKERHKSADTKQSCPTQIMILLDILLIHYYQFHHSWWYSKTNLQR